MHCVAPELWPIFDQHTYRAMRFMVTGKIEELSGRKAVIYAAYQGKYIPHVRGLGADWRKIDRALYSFGQFLKMVKPYR
jgi:hypothetical protein